MSELLGLLRNIRAPIAALHIALDSLEQRRPEMYIGNIGT
jgi:hypothetical protein